MDQEELEKFKSYYEDRERAPEDQLFEAGIHEKLLAGGSFHHFANRQSALAYMHGQFLMRKNQLTKIQGLEKAAGNLEKSGLTKRFMKVPSKLLPNDKVNCERELARATKLCTEIVLFKKELVILKKNCLDENQSVKVKKIEEFAYYSDKLVEVNSLMDKLEKIRSKLSSTNIQVNKSSGVFSKGVSILENKRIMRRRKENKRDASKNAFKRDVASLDSFLLKYTTKDFKDVFKITEENITTSKNQYARMPTSTNLEGASVDEVEELSEESEDEIVESNEKSDSDVEQIEVIADFNENSSELVPNFNLTEDCDVDVAPKKPKYKHEKLVRTIKLSDNGTKLGKSDFKSFKFTWKDLKGLKLILKLGAVTTTIECLMQTFVSEKEKARAVSLKAHDSELVRVNCDDPEEEIIVEEENQNENNVEENQHENYVEENQDENIIRVKKPSHKKLYKKAIKKVLEDNGNKMKIKKLKKIVLEKSVEFDESDADARRDSFDKYIAKVGGLVIEGKYVSL